MRIEAREARNRRRMIGWIEPDPAARSTRVTAEDTQREVYLNWDGALDDAGRLRKCIVCGCGEMFYEKAFPQVTGIVVVLAFAGAAAGVFGLVTNIPVLLAMVVVLIADISILLFSRKRLVCYRCLSRYHDLAVARYHRRWDRLTADRYAEEPEERELAEPKPIVTVMRPVRLASVERFARV